jgi:coatomer subunit beta
MTSTIRVGQSKFVSVTIDEDSADRILQCIQTLSELEENNSVKEIFMVDTKTAYAQMLHNEEVRWKH